MRAPAHKRLSGLWKSSLLIEGGWRWLDDINRVGGRKGIFQALLQGFFEATAPLSLLLLGDRRLHLGFALHGHGSTPCMLLTNTQDGPGVPRQFRLARRGQEE